MQRPGGGSPSGPGGRGQSFGPRGAGPVAELGGNRQERIALRLRDQERIQYFRPGRNDEPPAPRPELFDDEAERIARRLAEVPASQLRRFFGAVQTIKRKLEVDSRLGSEFIRSEMALLKAKAAYALTRLKYQAGGDRDPDELLILFVRHGRSAEDRTSFLVFVRHFEAIMAYHKVFEVKKDGER